MSVCANTMSCKLLSLSLHSVLPAYDFCLWSGTVAFLPQDLSQLETWLVTCAQGVGLGCMDAESSHDIQMLLGGVGEKLHFNTEGESLLHSLNCVPC